MICKKIRYIYRKDTTKADQIQDFFASFQKKYIKSERKVKKNLTKGKVCDIIARRNWESSPNARRIRRDG